MTLLLTAEAEFVSVPHHWMIAVEVILQISIYTNNLYFILFEKYARLNECVIELWVIGEHENRILQWKEKSRRDQ